MGATLTTRHILFLLSGSCGALPVHLHALFPLGPTSFSLNAVSLPLLREYILQVLRPPVRVLGVLWVLERARRVQVG